MQNLISHNPANTRIQLPHYLIMLARETRLQTLRMFRDPGFAFPSLLFPWMCYLFFGVIFGDGKHAQFLLANYGVFGVIGVCLFSFAETVALDRENGILKLKKVLPMPSSIYFLSIIGCCCIFSVIIITGLIIIATTAADVSLPLTNWIQLSLVLLLGTLPFCAIGLLIGLMLSPQATIAIVNMLFLPMAFLSGLWIPLFLLPALLQKIAIIWPAYHFSIIALNAIGTPPNGPFMPANHAIGGGSLMLSIGIFALMTLAMLQIARVLWQRTAIR